MQVELYRRSRAAPTGKGAWVRLNTRERANDQTKSSFMLAGLRVASIYASSPIIHHLRKRLMSMETHVKKMFECMDKAWEC